MITVKGNCSVQAMAPLGCLWSVYMMNTSTGVNPWSNYEALTGSRANWN